MLISSLLSSQVEMIGGSDMYISVCRSCFLKDNVQNNLKPYQSSPKKQKTILPGSSSSTSSLNNSNPNNTQSLGTVADIAALEKERNPNPKGEQESSL